jgi:hypothetical protein
VIEPLSGSKRGRRSSKYTQLIFFDHPGLKEKQMHSNPVVEEILDLDLDCMTPREAHGKLAEYHFKLNTPQLAAGCAVWLNRSCRERQEKSDEWPDYASNSERSLDRFNRG